MFYGGFGFSRLGVFGWVLGGLFMVSADGLDVLLVLGGLVIWPSCLAPGLSGRFRLCGVIEILGVLWWVWIFRVVRVFSCCGCLMSGLGLWVVVLGFWFWVFGFRFGRFGTVGGRWLGLFGLWVLLLYV